MLWVEVVEATGGAALGLIGVYGVSIGRAMDGPGTVGFSCAFTPETEKLLTIERRVHVYMVPAGERDARLLASGIIRTVKRGVSDSTTMSVDGPELLDELKDTSVLLNRAYEEQPLATVVSALCALAGWTATVETSDVLVSARFDGVSVLKALQEIAENNGLHLRSGAGVRVLEFGAFGTATDVVLMNSVSAMAAGRMGIINRISIEDDGNEIVNWLLAIGAGEGEAATTLKNSTRTGVLTMTGADGRLIYYVQDAASVALYGKKMRAGVFKEIAPLNNSVASKRIAANALYDASVASLKRSAYPIRRYEVSLPSPLRAGDVRVGDVVRLAYSGPARMPVGKDFDTAVDADVWVLSVRESYGADGGTMSLSLATADKVKMDAAKVIIGALETLQVRGMKPQPFPISFSYAGNDVVSARTVGSFSRWADFFFRIDNKITELTSVTLSILTKPIFTYNYSRMEPGVVTGNPSVNAFPHTHTLPGVNMTSAYDVVEGTNYPSDVTLWINGVDVSATYGGPWNVGGINAQLDLVFDITNSILLASTIYQKHTIQLRCGTRTGNIVVPGYPGTVNADVSHGIVSFGINVQGTAQAIISN